MKQNSDLPQIPMSQQRKWQLRQAAAGNCITCGKPAEIGKHCAKCAVKNRAYRRQKYRQTKRYRSPSWIYQELLKTKGSVCCPKCRAVFVPISFVEWCKIRTKSKRLGATISGPKADAKSELENQRKLTSQTISQTPMVPPPSPSSLSPTPPILLSPPYPPLTPSANKGEGTPTVSSTVVHNSPSGPRENTCIENERQNSDSKGSLENDPNILAPRTAKVGVQNPPITPLPDRGTSIATATLTTGIPEQFAAWVYDDWASRDGRDAAGVEVRWLPYVIKRWSRERKEWKSGEHVGNQRAAKMKDQPI